MDCRTKRAGIRRCCHSSGLPASATLPRPSYPSPIPTAWANTGASHAAWRARLAVGVPLASTSTDSSGSSFTQMSMDTRDPRLLEPELTTFSERVEDEQATVTPGTPRSPPPEVILSPATPPMPASCIGSEIFWLVAGAYVGRETVPPRGRASWVALGDRGHLQTCTREIKGSRRATERENEAAVNFSAHSPACWGRWQRGDACIADGRDLAQPDAASTSTHGDDPQSSGTCEETRTPEQHGRHIVVECRWHDRASSSTVDESRRGTTIAA